MPQPLRALWAKLGDHTLFRRLAWGLLGYNVLIMLWGAYVRASKSGDGCGTHWPTCNGDIIPVAPAVKTMIEFGHRLSIVALLPLLLLLLVAGFQAFPKKHIVRRGVVLCVLFTFVEAIIGAGLVLFKLVANNESTYRVVALSAHLVNNLFLLTALTLTAYWASGGARLQLRGQGKVGALLYASVFGTIIMAITGAIAALGDVLYKDDSLLAGMRRDFAVDAGFILRHRPLHPLAAIIVTVGVIFVARYIAQTRPCATMSLRARRVQFFFIAQTALGIVTLLWLAPIPLQIAHLLMADLLWINLILFAATALAQPQESALQEPRLDEAGREEPQLETFERAEVNTWPSQPLQT